MRLASIARKLALVAVLAAGLGACAGCPSRANPRIGGDKLVQRLTDSQGRLECSLEWEEVWITVLDPKGGFLGAATAHGGIALLGSDRKDAGRVAAIGSGVAIQDAAGRTKYTVARTDSGWRIDDARGPVARLARTKTGFEVTAGERAPVEVSKRDGKVVFETAQGALVGELEGDDLEGAVWFAVSDLSLLERAGLCKYVSSYGP